MSNFTKSILYSATVLAVGLIAIFAIYNNVITQEGASIATLEPASGTSEMGVTSDEMTGATEATGDEATDAASATGESSNFSSSLEQIQNEARRAMESTGETVAEDAAKAAAENPAAVEPAAGEATTEPTTAQ